MTLVTVIIPVHNQAKYLPLAIESVLKQTLSSFEIIIVNDGSTDNIRKVLIPYFNHQKIYIVHQANAGLANARNRGLKLAEGEFIAYLDADDEWQPEKLVKQTAFLQSHENIGVVFADVNFIDAKGEAFSDYQWDEPEHQTLVKDLLLHNVITGSASSAMIRKSLLLKHRGFDEQLSAFEDLDLWFRLALHTDFWKLEEPLVRIRRHEGNMQLDSLRMAKNLIAYFKKAMSQLSPEMQLWGKSHAWEVYRRAGTWFLEGGLAWRGRFWLLRALLNSPELWQNRAFREDLLRNRTFSSHRQARHFLI